MLSRIKQRLNTALSQLTLIEGSCLDVEYGAGRFDFVICRLILHFFPTETKRLIYEKIHAALKPGGQYLAQDLCVTQRSEEETRQFYDQFVSALADAERGAWNYKQPMSAATHYRLLEQAGFQYIEPWVIDRHPSRPSQGTTVWSAERI